MRTAKSSLSFIRVAGFGLMAALFLVITTGCVSRIPIDTPVTQPTDSYLLRGQPLVLEDDREIQPSLAEATLARAASN